MGKARRTKFLGRRAKGKNHDHPRANTSGHGARQQVRLVVLAVGAVHGVHAMLSVRSCMGGVHGVQICGFSFAGLPNAGSISPPSADG